MVEVFLVHPDLNVTDCKDYCSVNMKRYQIKYVRAVNEYQNLINNVIAFKNQGSTKEEANDNVQSLTENLSRASLDDTSIPALPDYNIELSKYMLSNLEKTLLQYYKTDLELAHLELNYVESYCLMNQVMREVFSKLELSLKEEEEGIATISKHTESVKSIEKELKNLKLAKMDLELILTNEYGLLNHQDQATFSRRKGSGNLNSINEEELYA